MEDNQAKCEGAGRSNVCVSYHALSEDWSEIADRTMEAHGYLDREEVNARLIAFARKLEQVLDKWETHAALLA